MVMNADSAWKNPNQEEVSEHSDFPEQIDPELMSQLDLAIAESFGLGKILAQSRKSEKSNEDAGE